MSNIFLKIKTRRGEQSCQTIAILSLVWYNTDWYRINLKTGDINYVEKQHR